MRRDLNAKKNCLTFSQTPIKKSRFYNLSFWFCKGNHNVSSENTTWGFMRFHFSCKCSWRNGKWSDRTRTRTTRRTSRLLPHLIIKLVSQQETLAFSRQLPEFLSSRSVLWNASMFWNHGDKLDSVCTSLMLGSNSVDPMPTMLSSPCCCCTYVLCLWSVKEVQTFTTLRTTWSTNIK